MERLVSSEFYNLLKLVSDQEMDENNVFAIFKEYLPAYLSGHNVLLLNASIYEPIRRSPEMKVTDIKLYNEANGQETNNKVYDYAMGNGGRVSVTVGLPKDAEWTPELQEDWYVLSRTIYLLAGRAKTMASLSNLMFYDQLTGIFNETGLTRFMGMTIERGRFSSYCSNFLNIKNMKLMINRYGEAVAEHIMRSLARKVAGFAKDRGNGVAARLGGDNFIIFIEKDKEEEFLRFVDDIDIDYESGGNTISISIGVRVGYYNIKDGDGINEAMRHADVASKYARNNVGSNYVEYETSMKTHLLELRQLEQSVPDAIKNREFVVYYQPKVDISKQLDFKLNGAEALVRWNKNGTMVPPGEFVPLLEKSGLISLIDYYVFEQVCIDINDWISRGITPVKVSSNFSRRHLQDKDFASKVESIIKKHNVDTKYLEIEITESYEDEDMQALMKFEKSMHALGVSLAVDDFGNGFSSIKMIKNIVADTIKLDKSIIDGIGQNGAEDIIVSHIIMMINKLGKKVVAEGVETDIQADFLRDNGCNNIQGFLFAKPCSKDDYESYMI